jgi:hypothetical protein
MVARNIRVYRMFSDVHTEKEEKSAHRGWLPRLRGVKTGDEIYVATATGNNRPNVRVYVKDKHDQENILSDYRTCTKHVVIQVTE